MLRTRLWMGAVLIGLASAMLAVDRTFAPCYPFLLLFVLFVAVLGCLEIQALLGTQRRQPTWFCLLGLILLVLANWPAHVWPALELDAWHMVLAVFVGFVLASFLLEMVLYREPGGSVNRIAGALWIVAYLGLLPSCLVQMRWLPDSSDRLRGVGALALAIFVPKLCDIGAYFTGRLLGRHLMTPLLSPKKTWEGLAGGLLLAVLTAMVFNRILPALAGGDLAAAGFGLTVGLAGVAGDLAESLIKRDCRQKDASQVVPGFGGVLDVIDSVIFAAPVAYLWLRWA